jgi:hypothetical protein
MAEFISIDKTVMEEIKQLIIENAELMKMLEDI